MSRYIDAYKLIVAVRTFFVKMINEAEPLMADDEEAFDLKIVDPLLEANKVIRKIIREQPEVEVVKVVHGQWVPIDIGDYCYMCSKCDFVRDAYLLEEDTYCPHCGARMDGEK